jgi:predicted HTH domain antitoxin
MTAGNLTVSLSLPRDLLGTLDIPEQHLESRVLELIALELFRQGRISTGKGAELLGMAKLDFIQLLARHQIDYFSIEPSELEAEVAACPTTTIGTHLQIDLPWT